MSTLVEPGARLAGRYRLQERLSEFNGSALWKAVDEPLARTVALRTFTGDFSRVSQVAAAARAASRVPDSRLAQVFDADENAECPYLVCEWIEGSRLFDLVARVPLEPHRAAGFVGEAAQAIATAHAAGLAHLRLDPSSLIWARGGTVKVTGLAIDAALHDIPVDADAGATDTRALGALLYAALTSYWPGRRDVGLPAAPRGGDGTVVPAGDVDPHVPAALESIAARALGRPSEAGEAVLDSPAAFRDSLAGVPRHGPPPPESPHADVPPPPESPHADVPPPPESPHAGVRGLPGAERGPERSARDARGARPDRRPARALLFGAVGLLVLVATGLGAWEAGKVVGDSGAGSEGTGGGNPAVTGGPTAGDPAGRGLSVASIDDYDPYDSERRANPEEVGLAVDGKAGTFWNTQTYEGPRLGGLKPGVGLMLDMGRPVSVANVRVNLEGGETSLALYAGEQPDIETMTKVATAPGASGRAALRPDQPVEARYVLVWLTKLPPVSDGYQAKIAEIAVRSPA